MSVALALTLLASGAPARADALPLPALEALVPADPTLEAALLVATNGARADHGLAPLTQDEGLARAAREHAAEMARLDYFSHGSPVAAHATLVQRLALAGSPLVDIAENIVMLGQPGDTHAAAQQAVNDWLNSLPHRKNLLGSYDRVGFGAARDADGRLFVVQDFASDPVRLLDYALASATRRVSEIDLELQASRATDVYLRVGSDAPQIQHVAAGTSTVVLATDLEGSVTVVAGIPQGGGAYLEDDGGSLDLTTGRLLEDPTQPRQVLRLTAARVRSRTDQGARLTLHYAPPATGTLALFLQGSYQPQARTAPGSFVLFLPDTLGVATVSVGVNGAGRSVTLLHSFHLDPGARDPRLLAGAAP